MHKAKNCVIRNLLNFQEDSTLLWFTWLTLYSFISWTLLRSYILLFNLLWQCAESTLTLCRGVWYCLCVVPFRMFPFLYTRCTHDRNYLLFNNWDVRIMCVRACVCFCVYHWFINNKNNVDICCLIEYFKKY